MIWIVLALIGLLDAPGWRVRDGSMRALRQLHDCALVDISLFRLHEHITSPERYLRWEWASRGWCIRLPSTPWDVRLHKDVWPELQRLHYTYITSPDTGPAWLGPAPR